MKGCLVRTTIVLLWLYVVLLSCPPSNRAEVLGADMTHIPLGMQPEVGEQLWPEWPAMGRVRLWRDCCFENFSGDYAVTTLTLLLLQYLTSCFQWFYASCFVGFKHWNQAAAGRCPATATMAMTATATTWLRMLQAASRCSRILEIQNLFRSFINIYNISYIVYI